ncbi:MAG: amidohydrolase family protein, partial [Bacteroidetes bacterium]|nr:amidohydrolase family protein [Bacteroidota bacterium]
MNHFLSMLMKQAILQLLGWVASHNSAATRGPVSLFEPQIALLFPFFVLIRVICGKTHRLKYICHQSDPHLSYQKFQATQLFTGTELLGQDAVLITTDKGIVEEIIDAKDAGEDIRQYNGILSPGFINCHCHLELSHMRGLIPEQTGLVDFVFKVVNERHFPEEEILDAIARAEDEMLTSGIVAVGDICNNTLTLQQKQKQNLAYYNFIEVSGWMPSVAQLRFERSLGFYNAFNQLQTPN